MLARTENREHHLRDMEQVDAAEKKYNIKFGKNFILNTAVTFESTYEALDKDIIIVESIYKRQDFVQSKKRTLDEALLQLETGQECFKECSAGSHPAKAQSFQQSHTCSNALAEPAAKAT